VSENDNCYCAGTTKAAVKVMGRNRSPEEENLEATSENRHTVESADT